MGRSSARSVADSIRFAAIFGVARTSGRRRRERAQGAERGLKTKGTLIVCSTLQPSLSFSIPAKQTESHSFTDAP